MLLMVFLFICKIFSEKIKMNGQFIVAKKAKNYLRVQVLKNLFTNSKYYLKRPNPSILRMVYFEDIDLLSTLFISQIVVVPVALISIFIYLFIMFSLSLKLSLVSMLLIPMLLWLSALFNQMSKKVLLERRVAYENYNRWFTETFSNWKTIKNLNLEELKKTEFQSIRDNIVSIEKRRNIQSFFPQQIILVYLQREIISKMFVYFYGGFLVLNGEITVGIILAYIVIFSQLYANIQKIFTENQNLNNAMPSLERLEIHLELPNIDQINRQQVLPNEIASIELKEVTYSRNAKTNILDEASFRFEKGKIYAITGASGIGKSTVLEILGHHIHEYTGKVKINDINYKQISSDEFKSKTIILNPESYLFNITAIENLKLIDEKRFNEKEQMIFEVLGNLLYEPQKVGSNGSNISGGQRQKIFF